MVNEREAHYTINAWSATGEELRLTDQPGGPFGVRVETMFEVVARLATIGTGWVDWDGEKPEEFPVTLIRVYHQSAVGPRGQMARVNLLEEIKR
jgi:hypothetical protein